MENSCKKGQHGRTSYGLGWQEVAARGCKSWAPQWGNSIHCMLIFIVLLFTNKKAKFSAIFCSLVKMYFSVFLILSFQSHIVGLHPFSPPGSPAIGGQSAARHSGRLAANAGGHVSPAELGQAASIQEHTMPVGYVTPQLPKKNFTQCKQQVCFGFFFPGNGKSHDLFLPASLSARVRACTEGL